MPFIFAVVLFCGVLLGITINKMGAGKQKAFSQLSADKLDQVMQFVMENYVDTVSEDQLYESVIDQMLLTLDPHSRYIPAEQLASVNEGLEGNFKGVGIQFQIIQDTVYVLATIEGGPSKEAGLMAGDRIIMVNDSLIAGIGINNEEVMKRLKGPAGTKVNVGIIRDGLDGIQTYPITRGNIPLFTARVAYMVDDKIGYIKIDNFNRNTHSEFAESLAYLIDQGMEDLIIDLQGNPGGILTEAVEIVDELMERKRLVTYTEGQSSPRFDYKTQRFGLFEEGELIVLMDQGSASASEIVAGAIQDWDRGLIVGRRSFGKGLVQRQIDLDDGSAIRLTIARYYTPSGRSIQKPYTNGYFEYENELYDRYENGELYSIDSLVLEDSTEYKTMGGRTVFGGGGILPDVFVPRDSFWLDQEFTKYAAHARTYMDIYFSRNSADFIEMDDRRAFVESWEVNATVFESFKVYAEGKENISESPNSYEVLYLKTMMKAELAKLLYDDSAYFQVMNTVNPIVRKGVELIRLSKPIANS